MSLETVVNGIETALANDKMRKWSCSRLLSNVPYKFISVSQCMMNSITRKYLVQKGSCE